MATLTADPGRIKEILAATDNLLRVHKEWENDPEAPVYPTAEFESAIEQCVEAVSRGDVPQRCLKLTQAVRELDVEWQIYANGQRKPDGTPYGSFWAAFREVLASRQVATPVPARITEPVHLLRRQGVSDSQIAFHIYGHKGEGPFLRNGQVATDLIEQELEKPGSVLGAGPWIHPQERERVRMDEASHSTQLSAMDDKIAAGGEPSKVENATALQPAAIPQKTTGKGRSKGEKTAPPEVKSETGNITETELSQLVRDAHSEDQNRSASDIVEHLRDEFGVSVTAIQVAAILRP